ncbi:AMP-dependent synthetase/ligase [Candidatus Zixiibacteriota bacterium]
MENHNSHTFPTIYQAFHKTVTLHPRKVALMYKDDAGDYQSITYLELCGIIDRVAISLMNLGITNGDRVAILSRNRPEWVMADLAILKLGAIVVPIYQTLPASAVAHILKDSGSKLLFVEDSERFAVIDMIRGTVPSLSRVVAFDRRGIDPQKDVLPFAEMARDAGRLIDPQDLRKDTPNEPEDTATIVYTSGTTGEPKGAVLSHGNIVSNALSAMSRYQFSETDVTLSYLPLCHMFERTCGYYTFLFSGGCIAYARDMTTIVEDVQTIQPTILIAVPRIIEKVFQAVQKKVLESSFIRRKLVFAAFRSLNLHANLKYKGLKIPPLVRFKRRIYDVLVASKFRKIAGENLRLLVTGGAPLDRRVAKALYILGFNIVEGYGLTETAPVVCCSAVEDNRLGTVGKPLPGVEVKIGDGEEILVRGPNVMKSYFNKPEETARTIDKDGWFHTGDQGRFDKHGNLIIAGRIKELIITSYGKNVAPVPIESAIMRSGFIEQAVLSGDNRKYLSALIVPRKDALEQFAASGDINAADYEQLLQKDEIRALILAEIEKAAGELPNYAKVKAFTLLPESFSVDNELLTPTLKLRRRKILIRFRPEIDAMYQMSRPEAGEEE